jgi:hypothetical protein
MGFQPLRQKRLEITASDRIDANNPAHAHHPTKGFDIANILEDIFYPNPDGDKRQDKPNYLIKLEEIDESEKPWYKRQGRVTGLEKFTGRDFAIGSQVGAIIGTAVSFANPAAMVVGIGGMALAGGIVGGTNDYFNNDKEMQEGALIEPPTHFNRDAVKYGLGWAIGTKAVLAVGALALTAATGGLGAGAAAFVVPEIVTTVAMVCAGLYGAKKGMDEGYDRMQQDYVVATVKNQRPELSVSQIKQLQKDGIEDLGLGAGAAITSKIAENIVNNPIVASAQMNDIPETTKWREQYQPRQKGSFVDMVSSSQATERFIG